MSGLIERAGDLKQELVRFARSERFSKEFRKAQLSNLNWQTSPRSGDAINELDHFILEHALSDGLTVADHFAEAHSELSLEERALVLSWKDVVQGIFEIDRHEDGALIAVNLADDLTYRIRSNKGAIPFRQMPPHSFLITRLVPFGEEWMLSGSSSTLPAASKREVYNHVKKMVLQAPALVFRNPAKRERAIEMQREEKHDFVAFFGSDRIVFPSKRFSERMNAYTRFRVQQTRTRAAEKQPQDALLREQPLPPELQFPRLDWLDDVETVGVIYDEVEGMTFWPDYDLVVKAFADPELVHQEPFREALLDYVQSEDISSLPICLLADENPEKATQLFRNLFPQPRFVWSSDGMKLLESYKQQQMRKPPLPSIIPISERLSQVSATPPAEAKHSADKKVGRNEPCPCGSGKKFKQCCG